MFYQTYICTLRERLILLVYTSHVPIAAQYPQFAQDS